MDGVAGLAGRSRNPGVGRPDFGRRGAAVQHRLLPIQERRPPVASAVHLAPMDGKGRRGGDVNGGRAASDLLERMLRGQCFIREESSSSPPPTCWRGVSAPHALIRAAETWMAVDSLIPSVRASSEPAIDVAEEQE
ncbi:unnamed protein product [Urochloa humidicola]